MNNKRRQLLAGVGVLAGVAAFPGLARAQGARPESANLALGFGVDPPFAPHILGITQGWFKDAGFATLATDWVLGLVIRRSVGRWHAV